MIREKQYYVRFGKITALTTFIIATIICSCFFFTGDIEYGFYGYFFFLFAFPINLVILIFLVWRSRKFADANKILNSVLLMLLNIPVAIVYFFFGIYMTGIMRITFENNTGETIRNINIMGCENKWLDILENTDSETFWIDIDQECAIEISYQDSKGKRHREVVVGYVSSGIGHKFTYQIGQGETEL